MGTDRKNLKMNIKKNKKQIIEKLFEYGKEKKFLKFDKFEKKKKIKSKEKKKILNKIILRQKLDVDEKESIEKKGFNFLVILTGCCIALAHGANGIIF